MTKKLWGIGDIMKAGFIGTGSIGAPLASNILDQEKALAVCLKRPSYFGLSRFLASGCGGLWISVLVLRFF